MNKTNFTPLSKNYFFVFFLFLFMNTCINAQTYNLVWADEFNGTGAPDPAKWGYELGYQRNNELQYYTNSTNNTRQFNGNLEVTVLKEAVSGYNYTSGSITTEGKASWTYGKIEGRFKMPKGQGLWPAFWTLGTNNPSVGWPACGEIDIFEHINNEDKSHHTVHWANANGDYTKSGTEYNIDVTQWHVYSIIWDASNITWYVDDVQVRQFSILNGVNSTQEFHLPQYVLINFAIGGSWPGNPDATTVLPATMYCDYIRVYEEVQTGNVALTSLYIAPITQIMQNGATQQLTPSYIPYNTTNKAIIWTSSNQNIATVSSTGLITAHAVGTATITATSVDGGKTATCNVTVKNLIGVNQILNPSFELDRRATQIPKNWNEWSSRTGVVNARTVKANTHSGTYKGIQTGTSQYDVAVSQKLTGLPNGTYTAKAWVRSSGGQPASHLYAKGFGGTEVNYSLTNPIATWTQVVINNIVVTNNSCEIGFYSWANSNQWIEYDDVEFYLSNYNSQRIAKNVEQLNVKQLNENPIITLFPNPIVNNLLNIQTSGLGEYEVVIVDLSGRVVLSSKANGDFFTLNTSVLKSGLYFVKIMNSDFYKVEKIIVK